jgi:xylose isomerase
MHRMYLDSFETIHAWQAGHSLQHTLQSPNIVCDLPGIRKDS